MKARWSWCLISMAACAAKQATPPPSANSAGPPPSACPEVIGSCTTDDGLCFEGPAGSTAARCEGGGAAAAAGACPRDTAVGTCTAYEKLLPNQQGCATLVVYANGPMADPAALRDACARFGGTYAP